MNDLAKLVLQAWLMLMSVNIDVRTCAEKDVDAMYRRWHFMGVLADLSKREEYIQLQMAFIWEDIRYALNAGEDLTALFSEL